MARGKRTRPLLARANSRVHDAQQHDPNIELNDDVDNYLEKRHADMQGHLSDNDSDEGPEEPEMLERDVMPIDMSDSDSDEDGSDGDGDGVGDNDDDSDGDGRDWGTKRKQWYGGDTQDYEIMEDEERAVALREEEEEAIRLQKKALSSMQPEDFRDEEEDGGDHDADDADSSPKDAAEDDDVAPEVVLLLEEMKHSQAQLALWGEFVHKESARVLCHLHSSFVSNVIFYLALRTDPEAESIDVKKHPVLMRIVRLRGLLLKASELPEIKDGPESIQKASVPVSNGIVNGSLVNGYLANGHHNPKKDSGSDHDDSANEEKNIQLNGYHSAEKSKKKKKKKKRKRLEEAEQSNITEGLPQNDKPHASEDEDEEISAFLAATAKNDLEDNTEKEPGEKRRKLNKLVGAMEREKQNKDSKRQASADVDYVPAERKTVVAIPSEDPALVGESGDDDVEDEEKSRRLSAKKAKKEARKAKKAAAAMQPHVYTFDDSADPEGKRRASTQVVKNRGLTRYRPRDKKTPRTKNKLAYAKALVRRKSTVRDYTGTSGPNYSGEASGINISARKGSKL